MVDRLSKTFSVGMDEPLPRNLPFEQVMRRGWLMSHFGNGMRMSTRSSRLIFPRRLSFSVIRLTHSVASFMRPLFRVNSQGAAPTVLSVSWHRDTVVQTSLAHFVGVNLSFVTLTYLKKMIGTQLRMMLFPDRSAMAPLCSAGTELFTLILNETTEGFRSTRWMISASTKVLQVLFTNRMLRRSRPLKLDNTLGRRSNGSAECISGCSDCRICSQCPRRRQKPRPVLVSL